MLPVRLFDSFLQPPSTLASVPLLGQLGLRDGLLLGGCLVLCLRLGGLLLGPVGLLLGALFGLSGGLWLRHATLDGAPLLAELWAIVRFWMLVLLRPQLLAYDPQTDRAPPTGRTVAVLDSAGQSRALHQKGRTS